MSKIKLNNSTDIDLQELIDTRLLVQANSGGGKSWAIRRIIEQSFGKVQIIVLDPEGEFTNLRSKYDFVLAGQGGEAPAEPRSAAILAQRLLELRASAIIDLYELRPQERKQFVRLFIESMVNAPKKLWHDCLVILDEADIFAPEKSEGESEALGPVLDLASRGRKRGYCMILATQRIPKLHKDASAECNNKLIGRASQDIDRKRAANELGFYKKEQVLALRNLEPGEFYAFGPAISREVIKIKIGDVTVKPPPRGQKGSAPPPPTAKVKELLKKLADLPKEAKKEAQTIAELKTELVQAKRHRCTKVTSQEDIDRATKKAVDSVVKSYGVYLNGWEKYAEKVKNITQKASGDISNISVPQLPQFAAEVTPDPVFKTASIPNGKVIVNRQEVMPEGSKITLPEEGAKVHYAVPDMEDSEEKPIIGGGIRMLKVLVSRHPMKLTRAQLATFSQMKTRGGAYSNYLSVLRTRGFLKEEGGFLTATEEAIDYLGETPNPPQTSEDVIEMWRGILKGKSKPMFDVLVEEYPLAIMRENLAERLGMEVSGGAFGNYLSILRTNGLMVDSEGGVKASESLFI